MFVYNVIAMLQSGIRSFKSLSDLGSTLEKSDPFSSSISIWWAHVPVNWSSGIRLNGFSASASMALYTLLIIIKRAQSSQWLILKRDVLQWGQSFSRTNRDGWHLNKALHIKTHFPHNWNFYARLYFVMIIYCKCSMKEVEVQTVFQKTQ